MKPKQILLILLLAFSVQAFAELKPVTILSKSGWILVDMKRGVGRPRNSVRLTLPPHTNALFYIISTTVDIPSTNYGDRKRLEEYIKDYYSGNSADSLKSVDLINPTDTAGILNAYLFTDSANCWAFCQGKPASYINEFSYLNFKGGVVFMNIEDKDTPTDLWVGISNTSNTKSVNATIEAVALIDDVDSSLARLDQIFKMKDDFQQAHFNGDLIKYINTHLSYPPNARDHLMQSRIQIEFQVNEAGVIHDAGIKVSADFELDSEALRVIKNMPQWIPATKKGKPINMYFSLPITFQLDQI